MYFWNSYPFIRLSIVFVSGILVYDQFPTVRTCSPILILLLILLAVLCLIFSFRYGFYKLRLVNGVAFIAIIFIMGGELTRRKHYNHPSTYHTWMGKNIRGFSGVITNTPTENSKYSRYDLKLLKILSEDSSFRSTGTIHLYIRKDSTPSSFQYGDILLVSGRLFQIPKALNPNQFDYKTYLRRKGVYGQCFTGGDHVKIISSRPVNPIMKYAFRIREEAELTIDRNIPEMRENGIAKALLIGIKDQLDPDVKNSYSTAGAMHVLAVSGLHVGILYLFLKFLLGKLRSSVTGRKVFGVISILIIWFYAVITGLSPSVLRAAIMFTVVAMSEIHSRKGNIYNTLGVAAFVLLLFDPYLVYSVGFQLSFAAVFGIVYLQPRLYRLIEIDNPILDKAWGITCVSLAAQAATLPLSLFYFHQFPTYFLLSNLLVIPAASIMLTGGIIMLLLDPIIHSAGSLFGLLLSKFIWMLNELIEVIESLPSSLLRDIYIDQISTVLIYVIILLVICGLHFCSFKTILICTVTIFIFLVRNISLSWNQSGVHQLVFYQSRNRIAIDHINGFGAVFYTDDPNDINTISWSVDPYRIANQLNPVNGTVRDIGRSPHFIQKDSYKLGVLGDRKILILDSTTFHLTFDKPIKTDLLVIENEAVKNLSWLSAHFQFEYLILGNSNRAWYVRKMKEQSTDPGLPIHALSEDGAFILDLKTTDPVAGRSHSK